MKDDIEKTEAICEEIRTRVRRKFPGVQFQVVSPMPWDFCVEVFDQSDSTVDKIEEYVLELHASVYVPPPEKISFRAAIQDILLDRPRVRISSRSVSLGGETMEQIEAKRKEFLRRIKGEQK